MLHEARGTKVAALVLGGPPLAWAVWIALPPVVTGLLLPWAGRHERATAEQPCR